MGTREEIVARLTAPGARFEIRTEEVLGERMAVFANRHRSLGEVLFTSRQFGDREYVVTERRGLTFAEHADEVAALTRALRDEYGVAKGDRVALCAANCPEWIVGFWATVSLGAIAVGMNSMWAAPEIAHGLEVTEPAVLIADAPRGELMGETSVPVIAVETDFAGLVERYRGAELVDEVDDEDEPAVILFTSGTSGRPKGATHSHRNMICALWFHLFNDAVAAAMGYPLQERRYLLVTPLFHIAALHNLAVIRLAVGDTAVLHLGRFDIERVLRLVEAERVTNWGAVPTMLSRVVAMGDRLAAYDLGSLRTVSISSAPSTEELKEGLRRALPSAGQSLSTNYGMTESSSAATVANAAELRDDPATVGKPVPTMRVEIRDVDGNPVPEGTEGEIHLRGPQMMLGYWGNPAATEAAFAPGRWYRTGDLGILADGHLRLRSRRSDLILRGGENIYPAEVEERICRHPAVRECLVMGVSDADLGQVVAAVVVLDPGAETGEDELREHTLAGIARYKVPTQWAIRTEELPRNATGKIDRRAVRIS